MTIYELGGSFSDAGVCVVALAISLRNSSTKVAFDFSTESKKICWCFCKISNKRLVAGSTSSVDVCVDVCVCGCVCACGCGCGCVCACTVGVDVGVGVANVDVGVGVANVDVVDEFATPVGVTDLGRFFCGELSVGTGFPCAINGIAE